MPNRISDNELEIEIHEDDFNLSGNQLIENKMALIRKLKTKDYIY